MFNTTLCTQQVWAGPHLLSAGCHCAGNLTLTTSLRQQQTQQCQMLKESSLLGLRFVYFPPWWLEASLPMNLETPVYEYFTFYKSTKSKQCSLQSGTAVMYHCRMQCRLSNECLFIIIMQLLWIMTLLCYSTPLTGQWCAVNLKYTASINKEPFCEIEEDAECCTSKHFLSFCRRYQFIRCAVLCCSFAFSYIWDNWQKFTAWDTTVRSRGVVCSE